MNIEAIKSNQRRYTHLDCDKINKYCNIAIKEALAVRIEEIENILDAVENGLLSRYHTLKLYPDKVSIKQVRIRGCGGQPLEAVEHFYARANTFELQQLQSISFYNLNSKHWNLVKFRNLSVGVRVFSDDSIMVAASGIC